MSSKILNTDLTPIYKSYNRVLGGINNSFRARQFEFIVTCFEAISNNLPAVIEGPTGLGKTKALLTVAEAYLNENTNATVLYFTRTMPQLQNVEKDLQEITSKLLENNLIGIKTAYYSIYIGLNSLRRLFCNRLLDNIITDDNELSKLRNSLNEDESYEPCPDCTIRKSRYLKSNELLKFEFKSFGYNETIECIKKNQCPIPVMKEKASEALIVLTTFPYMFNEFWKASVIGNTRKRALCLPIIDEAHNLIEMLSKSPSMVINLTAVPELGRGIDLNNNIFHISSLVENLKNGYKKNYNWIYKRIVS